MEPNEDSRLLPEAQPLSSTPIIQNEDPRPRPVVSEVPRGYPVVDIQSSHPQPSSTSVKCSNTTIALLVILGIILIGGSITLLIVLT